MKVAEGLIRDAMSFFSDETGFYDFPPIEFELYFKSKEFEKVIAVLKDEFISGGSKSYHVLQTLAKASAVLGYDGQRDELDRIISEIRGWEYHTSLPNALLQDLPK